jgi:CRP/FNR family transcriptional regulator, cyclic AMP receptor protein
MIEQFLRTVPLFQDLPDDDLAHVLMVGLVKRHAEQSVIVAEGSLGGGGQLHVVHQGQVRISKLIPGFGEEALEILQPGDFFGELEFLDGAPASTQAVAHTACEVLSIPHGEILALMESRPELCARFLWTFARALASRLRASNQRMASLLSISRAF